MPSALSVQYFGASANRGAAGKTHVERIRFPPAPDQRAGIAAKNVC